MTPGGHWQAQKETAHAGRLDVSTARAVARTDLPRPGPFVAGGPRFERAGVTATHADTESHPADVALSATMSKISQRIE